MKGVKITGLDWFVKAYFEPRDIWVGVFVKHVFPCWEFYIRPLPCFVIHVYQGIKF